MPVLPLTNGHVPVHEPHSQAEAEQALLAPPLTLGYKPQMPLWSWQQYRDGFAAAQLFQDLEAMLQHPHVAKAYDYYKSGIAHAHFQVKANSTEVARFVESMLRRFWERSLDQAQHAYDYGWGGYEVTYGRESGYMTFQGLHDFCPFDVWVLSEDNRYRGIHVANVVGAKGKVALWGPGQWPAKGFWLTHNCRWHRWYGRSQLFSAWRPWRRLATRDGMEDCLDGSWYRFGYKGPVIRYPAKAYPKRGATAGSCDGGDYNQAREEARQLAESAKAGISIALPGTRDGKGEFEWQIESWNADPPNLGGLIDVVKYLQDQISYGIGVPPELLEASEVGSGWSGRKIPMIGFYTGQLRNARNIVTSWRQQIGEPMVQWNFGPKAKFEIDVIIKVPDELEPLGGDGAGQDQSSKPGQRGQPNQVRPVQEAPQKPIQFSMPGGAFEELTFGPEEVPPPVPETHWIQVVVDEAPHLRVIGPTGSGKTTVAEAIAANLPGKLFVIDPVWEPGTWGGLPAVTVGPDGSFDPIRQALQGLLDEMHRRRAQLQEGSHHFERLTVLWDEVPTTVAEVGPLAGELLRRVATFGRHVGMHLIGIGQSSLVHSWGILGYGDTAENFATIYLGSKALEKAPELAREARPSVLEWQGSVRAIDLAPVLDISKRILDPSRAFVLSTLAARDESEAMSQMWDQFNMSLLAEFST